MEHGTGGSEAGPASYLGLIRYRDCIMSAVAVFLGAFVVTGRSITGHLIAVTAGMAVVFLFTGAGNSLNDYIDADIDRVAHPERPIPSGTIKRENARLLSFTFFTISILLSALINVYALAVALVSLAIMVSYEYRLKNSGLSGNAAIAWLTASLFLFGAVAVGSILPVWAFFATSFLATLGREVIKDVEDMDADKGIRKTLPMVLGTRKSMGLSTVSLAGAVAVSPFPFIFHQFGYMFLAVVIVADAVFAYTAYVQWKSAPRAQRIAKAAMYVAMLAFLVGALEV